MAARLLPSAALVAAIALGVGLTGAATAIDADPPARGGDSLAAADRGLVRVAARDAERDAEDRWLRERLGGLAALVVDPSTIALDACLPEGPETLPGGEDAAGVARAVTALRGLDFDEPVQPEFLGREEMAERVAEAFGPAGDDDLEIERRVLAALGAVPADIDLREVRVEAFARQVSGLHSGTRGEILLRVDDPGELSPLERAVLAHELEHALTYQQLGRPARVRDEPQDADERRASAAVVEGSATLAMLRYARATLAGRDRFALRRELVARSREGALAGHTPYLLAELQFPYTDGLRFACERYAAGGWEAVDATYAAPPGSSAEVLFDERYGPGYRPVAPPPLDEPDERWEPVHDEAFGAAELLWLLQAPGGRAEAAPGDARARAAAWDGGRVLAWSGGSEPSTLVGLTLAQRPGERSLCATLLAWRAAGWDDEARSVAPGTVLFAGAGRAAAVRCGDGGVRVGLAAEPGPALGLVGRDFLNLEDDA